jgi:AcrR family transcriptional regulator
MTSSTSAGANTGRESGPRLAIIEAASELFARYGIEGASMRQIADASGMSMGTINHHFGNKHGLVMAALEESYRLREWWWRLEEASVSDRLAKLAETYLIDTPRLETWWRFWMEYVAHAGRDPELQRHYRERYRRRFDWHCRLLREGVAAGEFRQDLDVERTVDELLALCDGIAVSQLAGGLSLEVSRAIIAERLGALRA